LGLVEQTLFNWVKAHREGTLKGGRQPVEGNPPSRWRSAACEPSWRG
jgi:transposase-like protein